LGKEIVNLGRGGSMTVEIYGEKLGIDAELKNGSIVLTFSGPLMGRPSWMFWLRRRRWC